MAGLLCILLALLPSARAQVAAPVEDDASVLVLGRVSDDPKAHYDQLKPLLDYVVPRMASVGIRSGRILMARDLQQMGSYLRRGRVDWVTETSGNAVLLERRANARSLLITERDGASRYHSVFFVRRDSPVRSLADLAGRSVAFQSPYSTSAYYLPASALLEAGQRMELLLSPMDKPSPQAVGYLFARTELNITTWVHKRLVDAGVLSNLDWANPQRMPPAFVADFRVVAESQDVPRALVLTRGDLEPKVEARLREVLMEASIDPDAGEALRRFIGTSRFVDVSAEDRQSLDRLGRGLTRVRLEVE
ncbi:MAG: phosphate/phosphite/phosphonate ABC transporter substrate-binding protein [Thermomonas sp.]|uniref:phosphate/phosphite/phosphonate ABC transporter substrate-binding protein n=1 Tax=Thermomonas sp. TaxID=1971895 RepID=UPI001EC763A3|nr:phosphate/phosphite/phosphonate ABC transporter substrate-binding protein [Thermomonas sp.]MBK6332495.1 phosphate/phosphite/phosphonate ABC transporter substrate-binding protein [Thermomonas sp.]MBK6415192.1 phosphate/phosphite/phosphonate ABC transporter substrate-binding protein [Thermomonas sp.]MBK7204847.1 phosphate/phosphite/phosphonate ABC transporter substrate-binding protein [Thermomonas sp.]